MRFNKLFLSLLITAPAALARPNGVGSSCTYQGISGKCIDTNNSNCGTSLVTGRCPGPANVRCCLNQKLKDNTKGVGSSCTYQGISGNCINTNNSSCGTSLVTGRCPGPANVRCCLNKKLNTNTKDNTKGVGSSCNYEGISGKCINTNNSSCGTSLVTGRCPGPANVRCCLDKKLNPSTNKNSNSNVGCYNHSTIASAAVGIAWETKAMGKSNNGTKLYQKVKDAVFPNDPYYQSCDRGVATAVHWSGADDSFPKGDTGIQDRYLKNSNLWTFVGAYNQHYKELKPGDIVITTGARRGTKHGHIVMYVGNAEIRKKYPNSSAEFVSASYQERSPGCGDTKSTYLNGGYHIYRYNGHYSGSDKNAISGC